MVRLTKGHVLFERWLGDQYGRSARTGRPVFRGMKAFCFDLNRALTERHPGKPLVGQAYAVYQWLATAKGPVCPRRSRQAVIDELSLGKVPASSWREPVATPRDEGMTA